MGHTILEAMKKQRLAWSCALIVGLFLTLVGHVPVFPVLGGCALAVAISTLRSASKTRPAMTRGGR